MNGANKSTTVLESIAAILNPENNNVTDQALNLNDIESSINILKDKLHQEEILANHPSPITLLPNGYYYTRVNKRKIQRRDLNDLKKAIVDIYDGNTHATTVVTIFDSFLNCRKKEVADTTWTKDQYNFDTYIKESKLGGIAISKIKLDDGYEFLEYCHSKYAKMKKKYWEGIRGTLNNLFMYAITRGFIKTNPFEHLKPKKDFFEPASKTKDGDTIFSNSEQNTIISLAESDAEITNKSEPLGIVLLFNLGLRDGELCALKWGDIESLHGKTYLHIQREMVANIDENGKAHGFRVLSHCKTPAGDRRLQLNNKAVETLCLIKSLNTANNLPTTDNDYVFMRHYNSEITFCTPRSFDPRLRKYCKHAGMDVIKSPHDVRRTVLTNLYYAGMPLKKIQEYAGHSSLKQTMDYIRISDDDLDMSQYLNTLSASSNILSFDCGAKNVTLKKSS